MDFLHKFFHSSQNNDIQHQNNVSIILELTAEHVY